MGTGTAPSPGGGSLGPPPRVSVNLVPLLWTGVPTRHDKNICRCFGAPACRVFPDHLITFRIAFCLEPLDFPANFQTSTPAAANKARGFGRRTLPRVVPEPRTKHGALSALTARRMAPPVPKRARMSDDDE